MALQYLPVRVIRLLKTMLILTPLAVLLFLLGLVIDASAKQKRIEEEKRATEDIHAYLERTSFCERHAEASTYPALKDTNLNVTVVEFCRQLEISSREFFSRRPHPVNAFNHTIVKTADGICNDDTYMVVLVHSLHNYRDRRDAIRRTWGGAIRKGVWPLRQLSLGSHDARVVFVFGQHLEAPMESRLEEESRVNRDIIQGDFVEGYRNMTLKSLLGLKWILDFCPSVKYLFKCDDDMFVNVAAILNLLRASPMAWSIMGPLNRGSKVYRSGKWGLTKDQYPFYYFPPYESGSGYAISADLIRPLLETSDFVPWIFIDDVYITGILGKILGVHHVLQRGFAYWTSKAPSACQISNGVVLTGTRVTPQLQMELWKQLTDGVQCPDNATQTPGAIVRKS